MCGMEICEKNKDGLSNILSKADSQPSIVLLIRVPFKVTNRLLCNIPKRVGLSMGSSVLL